MKRVSAQVCRPRQNAAESITHPVLSSLYRDPMVLLSNDQYTATGYKGWTTVLLSHGAMFGAWYFEVTMGDTFYPSSDDAERKPLKSAIPISFSGRDFAVPIPQPHIRVGWGSRYSRYDAPLGSDQYSVSIKDVNGSLMLDASSIPYANMSLGNGSTVGCGLILGPCDGELPDPRFKPELHPFLEEGLLCDPLRPPQTPVHSCAYVQFIVDGKILHPMPVKLRYAMYHPGISLYMGARARINTGPEFSSKPPPLELDLQKLIDAQAYKPACLLQKPEF